MSRDQTGYSYWSAKIVPVFDPSIVKDKSKSSASFYTYNLLRTLKMFEYKNLPETIPYEILETYLQTGGVCLFTKYNDEYYVFQGTLGGEPDVYYRPSQFIVANPHLSLNKIYNIGEDCVLMRNDPLWYGLSQLNSRYSYMLAENLLTMRTADVMLRISAMLSASDEKTKASGEMYIKKIEDGEISVIGEQAFLDGIKMQTPPTNNGSYLTQFIELHQFLTGTFFHEIGINANFNMKREAINEAESSINEDSLLPLCEVMLMVRKQDVEKINEMYGLDIQVDFSSAWQKMMEEIELDHKQIISQLNESEEDDDSGFNNDNDSTVDNANDNDNGENKDEADEEETVDKEEAEEKEDEEETEDEEVDEDNEDDDEESDDDEED